MESYQVNRIFNTKLKEKLVETRESKPTIRNESYLESNIKYWYLMNLVGTSNIKLVE